MLAFFCTLGTHAFLIANAIMFLSLSIISFETWVIFRVLHCIDLY